ncbi:AraC family transcriptional regulator [uncultured Winogradskyella sp.]|uniref:helix-turn-helix domain-containing protein n=1 Tax=uncultured Winogradskyella sp. TaxID=395353 RepID=UPI002632D92D|nr:AraC family transcriptional regulator [uncultured Winogradskyella sp.]
MDPTLSNQFFSFKNGLELVISVLAIAHGLFLILKSKRDNLLVLSSVFFILLGLHFLLLNLKNFFNFETLFVLILILSAYGPILYLMTCEVLGLRYNFKNKVKRLVLINSLSLAIYLFINLENKVVLWNLYILIFIVITLFKLNKDKVITRSPLVSTWLKQLVLIFGLINIMYLGVYILRNGSVASYLSAKIPFTFLFLILLINSFRFFFKTPNLLVKKSYLKTHEDKVLFEEIANSINQLMENEQLFLDSELSLNDLANKLNQNKRLVSDVINRNFGLSFHRYVNELRLKKAVRIMEEDKANRKLIKEIMYNSGFNNKVSFNNAFKKKYNLTPSKFRYSLHDGSKKTNMHL